MNKEKLREIEIARGIAILGVLLIHVTSIALMETPVQSKVHTVYLVLNRMGHFSVPAFIFLSGMVLFYRYFGEWHYSQSFSFYKRRIKYLLVPYVIWSAFYFLVKQHTGDFSLGTYFRDLITGGAEYHLYYVILIIQYYLLLPLLLTLLKKANIHAAVLMILAIVVQAGMGLLNSKYHLFDNKSLLSTTYVISFVIGCVVGRNYQRSMDWIKKGYPGLLTAAVFFMLLHFQFGQLEVMGHYVNSAMKEIVVNLFSIFAALSILYIGAFTVFGNFAILSTYGRYSLGVYFVHPAILSIAERYVHVPFSSALYHPSVILRMIIIATIPLGLVLAVKGFKWSWVIIGR